MNRFLYSIRAFVREWRRYGAAQARRATASKSVPF